MRRVLVAASFLALAMTAGAQTLNPGCDCYVTDPPPAGDSTVEVPALPAGFFGTDGGQPSDPFPATVIQVQGLPLPTTIVAALCPNAAIYETVWLDPHGTPVAANDRHRVTMSSVFTGFEPIDTIVCRPNPTPIPGVGGNTPVAIEIRELSLVSVNPITVDYGGGATTRQWDVFVREAGILPGGSMTIQTTGTLPGAVQGTMQMNSLPVDYEIFFEETTATIPPPPPVNGNLNFVNPSNGNWIFRFGGGGPAVPLLGAWGLLFLAAVLLGGGIYVIRKQNPATS